MGTLAIVGNIIGSGGGLNIPAPTFYAPLTSNLTLTTGTGSATFARASTAESVIDSEQLVRFARSGEARFLGARRVENLVDDDASEDMRVAAMWSKFGADVTIDDATHLTFGAAAAAAHGIDCTDTTTWLDHSLTYRFSVTVSSASAYKDFRLYIGSGTIVSCSATATPQRFSAIGIPDDGYLGLIRSSAPPGQAYTLEITDWQVELVEYQDNQEPGEYVTTHTAGSSGVKGVEYYEVENSNTTNGTTNVVSEPGNGAALSAMYGYLSEQVKTNVAWPSEDLTHANWTANVNNIAAANTTTAIGGLPSNTIKNTSASTDVIHSQGGASVSVAAATNDVVVTFFAAEGTQQHAFARIVKNGTPAITAYQFFNLNTGLCGANSEATITVQAYHMEQVKGGWRCFVEFEIDAIATYDIDIGISNADDTLTYSEASTSDVLCYMTGIDCRADHEHSQYIRTTTGTVTTVGDYLSYPNTNFPAGREYSVVFQFKAEHAQESGSTFYYIEESAVAAAHIIGMGAGSNADKVLVRQWNTSGTEILNAVSSALGAGTHKIGVTFSDDSSVRAVVVNGTAVTPGTNTDDLSASWSPTSPIYISCNSSTPTSNIDNPIKNFRIYDALTQSQLISLTS